MGYMMQKEPKFSLTYEFNLLPITRIRGVASSGTLTTTLSAFFIDDTMLPGIFKEHLFEYLFDEGFYTKTFETE